ncbi:hypothetical protein Q4Q66_17335 [Morganella morganii]|nr:hypothetical protein [Morganella morganii]
MFTYEWQLFDKNNKETARFVQSSSAQYIVGDQVTHFNIDYIIKQRISNRIENQPDIFVANEI